MRLLMGHPEAPPGSSVPVWQNGTPQSMQRAPCSCSFFSERWSWNSFQSRTRSLGLRSGGNCRSYSMKPVSLPMKKLLPSESGEIVGVELERRHLRLRLRHAGLPHFLLRLEDALEVMRHDPHE